jgi:hypothetical protein
MSFREEVLAFLKKNGVEYDERYVFIEILCRPPLSGAQTC